jgi:hypothetical protein
MTESTTLAPVAVATAAPADPLPDGPAAAPAGYPALLDALHEEVAPGRLVAAATGHVLASSLALPLAAESPLTRFGVAWTRVDPLAGPDPRIAAAEADRVRFALGLFDLRGALLRRVLRHCMDWLDGRTAEGSSLLGRQLNQGACADIAVEIAECAAMRADLDGTDPEAVALIGRRQTATGRRLLDLLGAFGFLSDGVAGELYLAELTANVYLHPGTENEDAHLDTA